MEEVSPAFLSVRQKSGRQKGLQAMSQTEQNLCFFALLDILGFKKRVKETTFDQLKEIVNGFIVGTARTVDVSRGIVTHTGQICSRGKLKSVSVRIVSDSICVWANQSEEDDNCLRQFDSLLLIVKGMLEYGLSHDLPLRGAITFGELFSGDTRLPDDFPVDFSFDANTLYGRAVVDANEVEATMNWSGAIVTPNAWAKVKKEFAEGHKMRAANIKRPEDLFNHFPYLVWWDVPYKEKRQKGIAINWNYYPYNAVSEDTIKRAFSGRGSGDAEVSKKRDETILFYKNAIAVQVENLPVPDETYGQVDLVE